MISEIAIDMRAKARVNRRFFIDVFVPFHWSREPSDGEILRPLLGLNRLLRSQALGIMQAVWVCHRYEIPKLNKVIT